jgi:hypothetical protein
MAINNKTIKNLKLDGINQALKAPMGTAEDIINFRLHPQGGYVCDRGIEPWIDPSPSFNVSGEIITNVQNALLGAKVDALFIWTKQSQNQTYMIVEQGGYLYYIWGNNGTGASGEWRKNVVLIDSNRHIPRANEVGTQFVPYGNRLLIINGHDKPIWFSGETWRDFSFLLPTPAPEVLTIDVDYLNGDELISGTASPKFTSVPIGLGDRGQGDTSVYSYKMSYIMDSGSESPLSASSPVSWTIPAASAAEKRFGVFINDFPVGPEGCVARRIYRTKNQRLSDAGDAQEGLFYFAKQINDNSCEEFIDIIPDNSLINVADSSTSQAIDSSYKYGATWNKRIWLAGGLTHPGKIIYSQAGIPEQFGVFNYFDVGNTKGGAITQLYAYYNNLLVFRESSIEVIRFNNGEYSLSQVSPNIGTRASNTIQLVPDIGIVFLSQDGFYAISGGLDGGSQIQVTKISGPIAKEVARISTVTLQKATATYSPKEKEYWCHYPGHGDTVPTRGAVIHVDDATWSLRHADIKARAFRFKFTALATDPDGNIIIGTAPTWIGAAGGAATPVTDLATGYLVGLHVWSGAPYWGYSLRATLAEQIWTYTATKLSSPINYYESGWIDFGDNSIKHSVTSIDVEMMSYGDNDVNLQWGQDYDTDWNLAGGQKPTKSETVFTLSEDPVFGPANKAVTKAPFTVGKSSLKEGRLIRIRWDVVTALVDNFRFRLSSSKPMHILTFNISYEDSNQLPLNQKVRVTNGQPY